MRSSARAHGPRYENGLLRPISTVRRSAAGFLGSIRRTAPTRTHPVVIHGRYRCGTRSLLDVENSHR